MKDGKPRVRFFQRISEITLVSFDLERPTSAWNVCGEGHILGSQARDPWGGVQVYPKLSGTFYMRAHDRINRNQILHGDQTAERKLLPGRPRTTTL